MKVKLWLAYAEQRNDPHPTEKNIESGYTNIPDIFKTVQISVQTAWQYADRQAYKSVPL